MAGKTHIYRDGVVQELPQIPGMRDLSTHADCLEDILVCNLCPLHEFFQLVTNNTVDQAYSIGEIGMALLEAAEKKIIEQFELINKHYGRVSVRRFTHWSECKDAGVAGKFIGVEVANSTSA